MATIDVGRRKRLLFSGLMVVLVFLVIRLIDAGVGFVRDRPRESALPEPSKTVAHITDEYSVSIKTNSLSLRSPEIPYAAPARKRVFVIGDSFVYGTGVEEEQSFTRKAEKILQARGKKVDLVNMGYVMQSPRTYLSRYRRVRARMKPDVVVLVIHTNDVMDMEREGEQAAVRDHFIRKKWPLRFAQLLFPNTTNAFMDRWIRNKVSQGQPNAEVVVAPAGAAAASVPQMSSRERKEKEDRDAALFVANARFLSGIYKVPAQHFERWQTGRPDLIRRAAAGQVSSLIVLAALLKPDFYRNCLEIPESKDGLWRELQAEILALKQEVERDGAVFGLAYVPSENQYDPAKLALNSELGYSVERSWLTQTSRLERELGRTAGERSVPFLNLTEVCREKASTDLVWPFDMHFNPRGHAATAVPFAEFVESLLGKTATQ